MLCKHDVVGSIPISSTTLPHGLSLREEKVSMTYGYGCSCTW